MPITDLLASITGEKPAPSSNLAARPSAILPKRKAEDELHPPSTKTARTDSTNKFPRPNGNSANPYPRSPLVASRDKPSLTSRPSLNKSNINGRPSPTVPRAGGTGTASANGSRSLPSRPVTSRPSSTDSAPPKKRSYAEIMARAKANSEHRESLGKIQHKTIERTLTMKERKEMKADEARKARVTSRKPVPGRSGTANTSFRDGTRAPGARNEVASGSTSIRRPAPTVEEKKVKKAALATTGYTGTARPRPGASTTAKTGASSRPSSVSQPRDKPRYGGPLSGSRRKYDDEEEELDDFIEYDEEEEPSYGGNARRYKYDSYEDDSDMEAGISDIEGEELKAARVARLEDQQQEALEKRLKREKEEKKRKFLEATKSKAGGR